jgi:RecB family exonuclease
VVLWWGTLAGAAEDGAAPRWTEAERAALAAAGALLPADGADRLAEHHRWQLPVLGCRERFVAVWWRSSGVEPAEPHPMFDAWGAAVGADSVARCTVEARSLRAADGPVPTVAVPPRPPRAPQWLWELPAGTVPLTRTLSATAIEAMLECPLRWTFEYAAGLRPGAAAEGADERAMIGDLAHRLLQGEVLYPSDTSFDALSPEQAEARVAAAFDARVATEAAPLLLPGQRVTLARARRQIVAAAPALVRALRAGGWRPVLHAEAEFQGVFAGQPTAGRADLVVQREDGVRAVIDLKLTGRRPDAKLRSGEALQLALYAQGFGQQGGLARGAYFAIEAGQLLATDPVDFPEPASHVTGPDLGETLLAGERAWQWWTAHVAAGRVVANGRVERPGEGVAWLVEQTGADDFDGPWRRAGPYCAGCSQRRLCGLTIGGLPAAAAEEEG